MTNISAKGSAPVKFLAAARKDTLLKNLLTKTPAELRDWWDNTATAAQKDDLMLRVVILVAGLAQNKL